MPFWLVNTGTTFQRAMDIIFRGQIRQSVVVYLDDVTMFSKKRFDHLRHLNKIFERCRKYGISLNPKKSIFTVSEGNLLGHIIEKSGIKVDQETVRAIMQIPFLVNKKVMQSFLGKISFLRKFISDYVQIMKPMHGMVKKDALYKWDKRENDMFSCIKKGIAKAPTLYNLDFKKYFLLYTFTSDTSLIIVLTQKDDQNNEQSIFFMSSSLQGHELNYPTINKQAYAVYKVVKHFDPTS